MPGKFIFEIVRELFSPADLAVALAVALAGLVLIIFVALTISASLGGIPIQ